MADKIDKSLVEEHLKCPICHGILEDARMLECGHSYCEECIGAVIESKARNQLGGRLLRIDCPFCRQNVPIQDGLSSALKQNWIVNNIVQVLAESERQEEEAPDTCEVHPGSEEDYYCKGCNEIVCCHCTISKHIHRNWYRDLFIPKKIEDEIDEIKGEIEALLENADVWSAQHVVYEDAVVDIKQVGSQAMDLVERDILQEYDACLEQLNQSRDRLLRHVTESKDSFCERMDELLQTEREYIDNVKHCSMQANDKIATGTDKDVVRFFKDWSEELGEIMLHDGPDMADAESDLKMVRALYFEKTPISSDSLYRDIGFIGNHLDSDDVQTLSSFPSSDDEGEDNQDMPEHEDLSHSDPEICMREYKDTDDAYQDFQFTCNRRKKISKQKRKGDRFLSK